MKYYLHVYKSLMKMNLSAIITYRANLLNSLLGNIFWGTFHIISILLLTSKTREIYGWKPEEIILLTATFSIMWGIFHVLFAKNFQRISRIMDLGNLDVFLLKPIDSQFMLSLSLSNFTGIFRLILGVIAMEYIIKIYHIPVTLINTVAYVILLICGLILVYSIWFIVLTFTVWFSKMTNLLDFLYTISGIMRYPPEIIRGANEYLAFLLLPLLVITVAPTKILLQKALLGDVIEMIIFTALFFFISRKFWKFALRYYTSASG